MSGMLRESWRLFRNDEGRDTILALVIVAVLVASMVLQETVRSRRRSRNRP
jgi:hypothetical protein